MVGIMDIVHSFASIIKRYFLSGVLIVVPLIVTYMVLRFLFDALDGVLQPLLEKLIGFYLPGLGVIATLIIIILTGIVTHNYIGLKLVKLWDRILTRVPLIRPIYSGAKGLLEATAGSSKTSFKDVAVIEYPRKGTYTICFIAQYIELERDGQSHRFASVFIPSTPTPLTGWSILVPFEEVTAVDMTIEAAIKFLVSGGVVSPATIKTKPGLTWKRTQEVTS
jgi:uncharacterized membrane protein